MTNKINPINGGIPASQESQKKSTSPSKVGKDVSRALNEALALASKSANRRVPPGGGRLSNKTTRKGAGSISDQHEEEVFHHAIAPVEKGHDGHNDHQRHPEVPEHHVILPMAEKNSAQAREIVKEAPVAEKSKARVLVEDSASRLKTAVEKQTAVLILQRIKEAMHSDSTTIYHKIFQIPSHFLGVVAKKLFDLGMWIPRMIFRPILKHAVRPALIKLLNLIGVDAKLEFLKFQKTTLALSLNYKAFIVLAKISWALPAAVISAVVFLGGKLVQLSSKKGQSPAPAPVVSETDNLAKIKAERQAQFAKDKAERELRIAREKRLKEKAEAAE